MFLDKTIFVVFFFFAGMLLTAIVAFIIIYLLLKKKNDFKQGGGSLLSIGSAVIGGLGGLIAAVVGIVLVSTDNYQWLSFKGVGKYILYFLGATMALGFVGGIVSKILGSNAPNKTKNQ